MSGLFPQGGVSAANTINGDPGIETIMPGCPPLFHPARCIPRFDAPAANAVISELINAINLVKPYDCNRLDNLQTVIATLTSLCSLVTTSPDLDDFLAGCFDGVDGKVSVGALLNVFLSQVSTLCELPVYAPTPTDYLAGCFGPIGAPNTDGKTQISSLISLIQNSISPTAVGAPFYVIGETIPFPNNQGNDTNVFDGTVIDGLTVAVPAAVTFASVGGPTHVLMPIGSTTFDFMNLEKINGQWYKMYGQSRNIMGLLGTGDQTQLYMTRSEFHTTSVNKLYKFTA